jgi:hypothetical protein
MVSAVVDVDPLSVVAGMLVVSGGWVDVDVGSSDPLVCAAVEVGRTLEVVGSAASAIIVDKVGNWVDVEVLGSIPLGSAAVFVGWALEDDVFTVVVAVVLVVSSSCVVLDVVFDEITSPDVAIARDVAVVSGAPGSGVITTCIPADDAGDFFRVGKSRLMMPLGKEPLPK